MALKRRLQTLVRVRWRSLLFRKRRQLLAVVGTITILLWIRTLLSQGPDENNLVLVLRDAEVDAPAAAQRVFTESPSSAERERQNRSALFVRLLGNKVKHSVRIAGGEVIDCMLPRRLRLSYDSNHFAFYKMPPLKCSGKRMFFVRGGKFVLNTSVVRHPRRLESCLFYDVKNYDDDFYFYGKPVAKSVWPFQDVAVGHDFVRIQCTLKDKGAEKNAGGSTRHKAKPRTSRNSWLSSIFGWKREQQSSDLYEDPGKMQEEEYDKSLEKVMENLYDEDDDTVVGDEYEQSYPNLNSVTLEYDQFSVQVTPKPEVFQRISTILAENSKQRPRKDQQLRPNVLMLGLGSVSHLTFRRLLPQTYHFLKADLGSLVLENYNVVGELMKEELIPLLTGKREEDLPDVQTWKYNAEPMNAYPFIWKEFEQQGYATLFAEDEPLRSLFNTGFYGFDPAPTDHYMRPFWQAVSGSEVGRNSPRFCTGDSANHRYTLQYLEEFFHAYRNVSKFAFALFRELSYTSINPVQYLDSDLVELLRGLKGSRLLEDTVVMVFSDRGLNDYLLKSTVLAKMEERMPMMSLSFPESFQLRHPGAFANLTRNAHRLTTPFDVHETLTDLLYPSRLTYRPPEENATAVMSLFEDIRINRTCHETGIPGHWCTCMSRIVLGPSEPLVKRAAQALLRHVNARADTLRDRCAPLELQYVHLAHLVLPTWKVLTYTHAHGKILKWQEFNSAFDLRVAELYIQVKTGPCGVMYEGTVLFDFRDHRHHRVDVVKEDVKGLGVRRFHHSCLSEDEAAVLIKGPWSVMKQFCCCRS
ncbi:uncharacterized protein LOC143275453 [Babylonia areolata]|uniref:uncharacterized protein LOC143275453 n=1 Tax=Babylonia areolata TaxID=304850 RepID=UPI003FD64CCA